MTNDGDAGDELKTLHARRRLKWFLIHLLIFGVVMIGVVVINIFMNTQKPWFVLPLVGWGAPLAIHAAFAMGLLDSLIQRD